MRRIEHDADLRASILDERNRDVPVWDATQEIVRAVDRIDDPAAIDRAGELRGRFLAEKGVVRERARQLTSYQRFHFTVGETDEVAGPFQLDDELRAAAPEIERERASPAREITGERVAIGHERDVTASAWNRIHLLVPLFQNALAFRRATVLGEVVRDQLEVGHFQRAGGVAPRSHYASGALKFFKTR
jgi:hypothetical protein